MFMPFAHGLADTKIADRNALSSAPSLPPSVATPDVALQAASKDRSNTVAKGKASTTQDADPEILSRLRLDLATTQKARATLQTQVDELTSSLSVAHSQVNMSTTRIATLTRQKTEAERKLRDRDEELRGKSRLVEAAHDEMVALGLQLNMSEARKEQLDRDNKELLDRWMKKMGEEAERVNQESKW